MSAHGLRIPVRHWRPADFEGFQLPLHASRIALVVVLVDDHFLAASGGRQFLLDTHAALAAPSRLLPVDLTSDGDRMPSGLTAKSVSIPPGSERMRIAGLLNAVTHTTAVSATTVTAPVCSLVTRGATGGRSPAECIGS